MILTRNLPLLSGCLIFFLPENESYSFDDIKDVVQRFLNVIRKKSTDGWFLLPLHYACKNGWVVRMK